MARCVARCWGYAASLDVIPGTQAVTIRPERCCTPSRMLAGIVLTKFARIRNLRALIAPDTRSVARSEPPSYARRRTWIHVA